MRRATAVLVVSLVAIAAFADIGTPTTDLNLRAAPSARGNVITVLGTSDEFEILETKKAWYRVRVLGTGAEGWVAKKYVVRSDSKNPETQAAAVAPRSNVGLIVALIGALLAIMAYVAIKGKNQHPLFASAVSLVVGALYIGFTLPKAMLTVGTERGWSTWSRFGELGIALNQSLASELPFPTLFRWVFWATIFYLLSLLFLAVRHGQLDLFKSGAAALAISVAIFHVVAWVGFIVVKLGIFVLWILGSIGRFLMAVFGAIFRFIGNLVIGLFTWIYDVLHLLLGELWWVVPAALVIALAVVLAKRSGELKVLVQFVFFTTIVGVGGYVVYWVWQWLGPWVLALLAFLERALRFLGTLLFRLLAGLLLLLAVATVGQLLLDQIQGALSAGRRRRGVVIGAIAIGSSIAILIFVSNVYGLTTWLPASVAAFAAKYLHQPTPLLDGVIALGIALLSIVSVWRNVPALAEEPTENEFGKSLVYTVLGVFFNGALVAIATQTED